MRGLQAGEGNTFAWQLYIPFRINLISFEVKNKSYCLASGIAKSCMESCSRMQMMHMGIISNALIEV